MNYLAHIHIAHNTQTSMVGNFIGDFVKGAALETLADDLRLGVVLHRKIDVFTDSHSLIIDLKRQFPASLRRMSGVVLDVYFDFLLCRHWSQFSEMAQSEVLDRFYQELAASDLLLTDRFEQVKASLIQHRWLENYQHRESFVATCKQIEKRLSNRVIFAQEADAFLKLYDQSIEEQFLAFYPELIEHAHQYKP